MLRQPVHLSVPATEVADEAAALLHAAAGVARSRRGTVRIVLPRQAGIVPGARAIAHQLGVAATAELGTTTITIAFAGDMPLTTVEARYA